ncbi:MAG: cysteine hydrolase [Lachnospiraceae bacterium]|jgi:nicotinamidase/pyrazinamidase|nr:cysteine hydrolase [Lachnospiraceae bacterium]MCI9017438.1 cysteine hydrolase [Lachnospiraceae bacterium]MCI9682348.1 cysteine hydrolase [Lachnospiraceae bacterium]
MKKLLLVIDMQNDFIDGALGTKEAAAIVPNVVKHIQEFEGDILYTRDTHSDNYMETQEGRNLPVPHCIKGTPGWELCPDLKALRDADNSPVLDKVTFGAKDLPAYLEARYPGGLECVELIGLCTDICVISNAMVLKAFFPELPVSVTASCCAGVTPESHENALNAMKMCQIAVL